MTFQGTLAATLVQELVSSDFTSSVSVVLVLRTTPAACAVNLFDLNADPFEQNNVAGVLANASVVTALEAKKNTLKTCVGATCQVSYP